MRKNLLAAVAILLIHTAGAQWQVQNAGFTNDTLGFYEFSLPDKNTAWTVCYDGKGGLLSGRTVLDFTRTTNGGTTWIPGKMGNDSSLRFSNISAIDGNEAWVAMHKMGAIPNNLFLSFGKGGGIFHTTDAGVTWERAGNGELFDNNSVPRFVHFKDRNHGVAMGDPNGGYFEVYITNNRGRKWKRVSQSNLPEPLPGEVGWISGHAVIGDTIWFGTSNGRMYKSIDFGKHWTVHIVDSIPGTYVNEIAFLDDGRTGVAHLRGRGRTFVFSTTDGGLTWTNYFQPVNWKNSRITAVPGTTAFISTSTHPNPLFTGSSISYDAGQTWTDIERTAQKAACRFYDASTGYAGGFFVTGPPFRGGIFKSEIEFETPAVQSRVVTKTEPVIENKGAEASVKVYPSPARDVVTVSLEGITAGRVNLISILSMDGKIIHTSKGSGSKLVQFNVSHLTPGLYVVRVETNDKTIQKIFSVAR